MTDRYIRNNGKYNADYSLRDLYREYKKNAKNPIDYKVYSWILNEYNDRIMKYIIMKNMSYKMPYRLGEIRGQRVKNKVIATRSDGIVDKRGLPPDWNASINYWKKIYPDKTLEEIKAIPDKKVIRHLNMHTDGYRCRFFWDKMLSNVKNQYYYIFKASRTNKNRMSSFVKDNETVPYYE